MLRIDEERNRSCAKTAGRHGNGGARAGAQLAGNEGLLRRESDERQRQHRAESTGKKREAVRSLHRSRPGSRAQDSYSCDQRELAERSCVVVRERGMQ